MMSFIIYSNIRKLEDQREKLKSTVQEADDAETLAHDALASIDARAEEITERLKITNALQHNHTEMAFAIGMIIFNNKQANTGFKYSIYLFNFIIINHRSHKKSLRGIRKEAPKTRG